MKKCIINGVVITMDDSRNIIEDGFVIIDGNEISEIGNMKDLKVSGDMDVIDARGGIVMPGFVNCHTHISMSVFRGLGEDMPDRLRRYMFPMEDELLDEEMVGIGARLSLIELIQGGVTTFCDMYYFEDEVAKAVRDFGMRAVLGETILSKPSPDSSEAYGGIEYAKRFISKWKGDSLITPAFAPHAPYTCDDQHLMEIKKLADELDVPITMHLSEMLHEMEEFDSKYGKTPIKHLEDIGFLSERLIAAHLVYVDDEDIEVLRRNGVGAAHNVVANAKSGRKVSPAPAMHKAGMNVGLGTDGPMSGNHQDILSLLGYYTKIQKQAALDNRICPAVEAVELGTIGGARVLGMADEIGSIEIGKKADIIIIDTSAPNIQPIYDYYSAIVYAAHPHNVVMTMVNGSVLMSDRKVLVQDEDRLIDEVREVSKRISRFARELDQRARL
ncbi:amidohydrolase [Youngiibacter multivorans]|uniref:Cytosine/adenosine deaminase-related metal-dependent hydrolase n=1 Tax=Youngiibacter multivorans TaxID=937251 RepID=A0ABS4G3E1_9CLOT|nr:amidohydrolase [Youngiibacter multivorans]MBP1918992.1 cytosine/adenosine deaminase-related metal-dependent hydrolase [Youngiibacter multivorans]